MISSKGRKRGWTLRFVIRAAVVPLVALAILITQYRGNGYADTGVYAAAAIFALLVDLATFVGDPLRNVLVLMASLVFGLGILDGYAAHELPKIDFSYSPGLWGPRPVLGWGPTRAGPMKAEEKVRGGHVFYRVTYTIDDDLLRVTRANPAGPTIAFFGDSFTFGFGLEDKDTLPQQFADLEPDFNVVNLAYNAYSPAQVLREMQVGLFDKRLTSPRLFLMLTAPWHAERTSCRLLTSAPGPHYVLKDGELSFAGPCAQGLWGRLVQAAKAQAFYRYFLQPILLRPDHDDIATWIATVTEIAKVSREKYGVPFVVLYEFPEAHYLDGTGYTNETIEAALRAGGAYLVDTKVEGAAGDVLTIPGDGHPTARRNELFASKVVDFIATELPNVLKLEPEDGSISR